MFYLIWGLINIGLFLFFLFICFQATKLIREKLGLLASLIFVFGLLSFVGHSTNESDNLEPNTNRVKHWDFNPQDSIVQNTTANIYIDLEKTLISKFNLGVQYGEKKTSKLNVPINAYSYIEGFISGTNWRPVSIIVNQTADNKKFVYEVNGTLEWKLLGATVYNQVKTYTGFISVPAK